MFHRHRYMAELLLNWYVIKEIKEMIKYKYNVVAAVVINRIDFASKLATRGKDTTSTTTKNESDL